MALHGEQTMNVAGNYKTKHLRSAEGSPYKTVFQESPLGTDVRANHRNFLVAQEPPGESRKHKPASPEVGAASSSATAY